MIKICNVNKTHEKDMVIGLVEPMSDISRTHATCKACVVQELRDDGDTESEIEEFMKKFNQEVTQ